MSDTSEERELQSDEIVDKKRLARSIVWNWFGYFKNDRLRLHVVGRVDQDGKQATY